ncbi:hypothetical protein BZL30_7808 [Mycobacterium kansasii]|uniref:Uncharacterized protein n=1 Tax=Mycobacterium kansasii TaxID=1768 RepID=A0A1V3WLI5_MYCKA|nr:hypothetical protein BZL30_7808 [Mycobacterium kansasii]
MTTESRIIGHPDIVPNRPNWRCGTYLICVRGGISARSDGSPYFRVRQHHRAPHPSKTVTTESL